MADADAIRYDDEDGPLDGAVQGGASTPLLSDGVLQALDEYVHEHKGRCMRAGRAFSTGEDIITEQPMVQGRCAVDACPGGCGGGMSSACTPQCGWAAAAAAPGLTRARACLADLISSADELSDPDEAAAWINTCCLLAITIQVTADEDLWDWAVSLCKGSRAKDDENAARLSAMFA